MRCSCCGNEFDQGFSFCPHCGTAHTSNQENAGMPPAFKPAPPDTYANAGAYGNAQQPPPYAAQYPYGNQMPYNAGQQPAYGYSPYQQFNPMAYNYRGVPQAVDLVGTISRRVQGIAIAWLIIGILQMIIAVVYFVLAIAAYSEWYGDGTPFLIAGLLVGGVGIGNILISRKNFKFSKAIRFEPIGIIEKHEKIGGYIASLVYNILIGAALGVVAIIMELVLRNFVMKNAYQLQIIEDDYRKTHTSHRGTKR